MHKEDYTITENYEQEDISTETPKINKEYVPEEQIVILENTNETNCGLCKRTQM